MAFFKFRQRGQPQPETRRRGGEPAAAGPQESIDSMRRRARHRLLGAAVLVLAAVVGFPLLFDTQPRPVVVDAPITIPDKDQVPPLRSRAEQGSAAARAGSDRRERGAAAPAADGADQAGDAAAQRAPESAPAAADTPAARPAARPEADTRAAEEAARTRRAAEERAQREQEAEARARREQEAQARREQEAQAKRQQEAKARQEQEARARREAEERARREEAARARALLEGRSSAAAATPKAGADGGRFIVQIGAFADADAARQVRQRAERAGVKTYTQVVDTAQGKRTRVRVGPYSSRAEAEQAAAVLKKAGLSGSILSL